MSIFGTLFASETGEQRDAQGWVVDTISGRKTNSGEYVTPMSAMGLSAYFACLRCISEDAGKLPLNVYRRRADRGKDKLTEHPVYRLLHDAPSEELTAMSFREMLTHWAMSWGGGYAEIQRDGGGGPVAMYPIHPSRVTPARDKSGAIVYVVKNNDATQTVIGMGDMLHIRGLGDTLNGYSVLRLASESIGLGLAAQTFGAAFFGNGTSLTGVLTHPGKLNADAQNRLRSSWAERYQGAQNAGKPAILEEGMKFERMGIPPEEAQFIETRQFQVEDICRWFRVPPHKIQHLERATNNNIEHQGIEYVTDALMPWLVRWEQECKRKLLANERDVIPEHLVAGLLRGDSAARSTYYRERFNIGTLSQNDIRELENENPIDNGDTYFVALNMANSKTVANGTASADAKPASADAKPAEPSPAKADTLDLFKKTSARVTAAAVAGAVRKETMAVARAGEKHAADPAAFTAWADKFYADHREHLFNAMIEPALSLAELLSHATGVGLDEDRVDGQVEALASNVIVDSLAATKAAFAGKTLDKHCAALDRSRAADVAVRLTDQIAYLFEGKK